MSLITDETDDQSLELLHILLPSSKIMNHSFFLPGTHLKDDRSSPAAAACVGMPWWSSSPAPGAISTIPWGCPQMPVHSESSPNHYDLVPKIGWIMPKNVVCLAVAK